MPQAEANRTSLYYSWESTWAETPSSPTMLALPYIGNVRFPDQKLTALDETVRSDRVQQQLVRLGENAEGAFDFNLEATTYFPIIARLLGNTPVTIDLAGTDIAVTSPSTISSSTTDFVAGNIVVGSYIRMNGHTETANNGIFEVATVAANSMTVVETSLVTEVAGDSVTIDGLYARNGTTKYSALFERQYGDISEFISYRGFRPTALTLNYASRAIITGTLGFMGSHGLASAAATISGSLTAAAVRPVMNSSTNVAQLIEGGTALATAVRDLTLNFTNNPRRIDSISNEHSVGINYGDLEITGSMTVYFENETLYNKFKSHTASSLVIKNTDDDGLAEYLTLTRLEFEGDLDPEITGKNTEVMLPLGFRVTAHPTLSYVAQWASIPAATP